MKAGLKTARISAYSLRHTTGQVLLKQGVDPIYVQRHLRHKNFATTQIYVQQQSEKEYFDTQIIARRPGGSFTRNIYVLKIILYQRKKRRR